MLLHLLKTKANFRYNQCSCVLAKLFGVLQPGHQIGVSVALNRKQRTHCRTTCLTRFLPDIDHKRSRIDVNDNWFHMNESQVFLICNQFGQYMIVSEMLLLTLFTSFLSVLTVYIRNQLILLSTIYNNL